MPLNQRTVTEYIVHFHKDLHKVFYFTTFQSKNKLYMEISLSKYVFSPSNVNIWK